MGFEGIAAGRGGRPWVAGAVLCAVVLAVYVNGLHGGFIFDDKASIRDNPSLHQQPWLLGALHPPHNSGDTVDGRPILNLSFALTDALAGPVVEAFHLGNILIHAAAALLLFGLVRRTCQRAAVAGAATIGFWVALLWAVHPLDTESVTYLVQRAESLMGFFYLLTLYCFVRSVGSRGSFLWLNGSVAACLLGMGTKEIMVSAPLAVLLYDRTFVAGSFAEAWRVRWTYYAGLAASWIMLAALVASTHARGGTTGIGVPISWLAYEASQPMAVLHYLRLAVWPVGLNFDYGLLGVGQWAEALWAAPVVLGLGVASVVGLVRGRYWGLLGFGFFAVLAPTSLLPGTRQALAEHRMYLALIPVVVFFVLGVSRWLGARAGPVLAATAVVLALLSVQRNAAYHDEIRLYRDSIDQLPDNSFALTNLGALLFERGELDEAALLFQRSLRAESVNANSRDNLGALLVRKGLIDAAIREYTEAIRVSPRFANAHVNLANALLMKGLPQAAIASYEDAEAIDPKSSVPENGMGVAYSRLGAPLEAIKHYRRALLLAPQDAAVHANLGNALMQVNRPAEAYEQYAISVSLDPRAQNPRFYLANALSDLGRLPDAIVQYHAAISIGPDFSGAHDNLGNALLRSGDAVEAETEYRIALRLQPRNASAHVNLASLLAKQKRNPEAIAECEAALAVDPSLSRARALLRTLRPTGS